MAYKFFYKFFGDALICFLIIFTSLLKFQNGAQIQNGRQKLFYRLKLVNLTFFQFLQDYLRFGNFSFFPKKIFFLKIQNGRKNNMADFLHKNS
jgi:hypothetical protein